MTGILIDIAGVVYLLGAWAFIVYALIRNQKEAKESPLVDTTNPIPRIAAIWEVIAHPGRAATWQHPDGRKVFPMLGKDLSEMTDIRDDDKRVT